MKYATTMLLALTLSACLPDNGVTTKAEMTIPPVTGFEAIQSGAGFVLLWDRRSVVESFVLYYAAEPIDDVSTWPVLDHGTRLDLGNAVGFELSLPDVSKVYHLRIVRAGATGESAPSEPVVIAPRYLAAGNLFTDSVTGITWGRCLVGQSFDAGECVGDPDVLDYAGASAAAATASARLPSRLELASLIYCDGGFLVPSSAEINMQCLEAPETFPPAVPTFPVDLGQFSETVCGSGRYAVNFEEGHALECMGASESGYARLVF